MSLRVIFMGTPDFAVPTLSEIIGQGHEVIACYTRAPAPQGRGLELVKSPVHKMAEAFGIPVFTPKSLKKTEVQAEFTALDADVAVVVAYGLLLPAPVLEAPRYGCLNLHGSLLPRWRGAAPLQRAIMAGDAQSGVMVMKMDVGLDTGPVAMVEACPITPDMTARDLHDKLMRLGADLMARALAALQRGSLNFTPQSETGITYAAKILKEEARIDWQRAATELRAHIHGLSPFPGAFTEVNGKRVKLLKVAVTSQNETAQKATAGEILDTEGTIACGMGSLRLLEVQPAGKAPLKAEEYLRGARLQIGSVCR